MSGQTISDVRKEIADVIEAYKNGPMPKKWVIRAVCEKHTDIQGSEAELFSLCFQDVVARETSQYFNKVKAKEFNPQLSLPGVPGYDRMQDRYIIKRNGELVHISIYDMTDAERLAKAEELEAMAAGCLEHANELRRFVKENAK